MNPRLRLGFLTTPTSKLATRSRGRKGVRPKSFGPKQLAAAKAMLADSEIRVEDVAAHPQGIACDALSTSPGRT